VNERVGREDRARAHAKFIEADQTVKAAR